ncbi:hypothetical protein WN55_09968 [Dufourea novaeangliae]|uniref:Uncharacterized protein n=1 Tax=Dufourea novaeangliae TaxID=178035 RepID=A0A154P7L2_DUFNO|nr:hypothetical protein WN55_09968 [Dufourea novaeangliae]
MVTGASECKLALLSVCVVCDDVEIWFYLETLNICDRVFGVELKVMYARKKLREFFRVFSSKEIESMVTGASERKLALLSVCVDCDDVEIWFYLETLNICDRVFGVESKVMYTRKKLGEFLRVFSNGEI